MPKKWYVGASISRGLPSTYEQLTYIKSTGTQYFDTGHIATKNTRLVAELSIDDVSTTRNIFGATDGVFLFNSLSANKIEGFYGNGHFTITTSNPITQKFTLEVGASAIKVNGVTMHVPSYTAFSNSTNILFLTRQGGSASARGHVTLYSLKLYENNVLVRDFVPCKNANAVVGLYDMVNGVFYVNSGTGTFTAGSFVPSGGVAREVKKPYFGVSNVARKVKKGYVGVDNVARLFFQSGLTLGDLDVGTSVWTNVNGSLREFIIVEQGIPSNSSLYDASCDGTWLLMKNISTSYKQKWHSSNSNSYKASTIHSYLNSTFLNLFDADIKAHIKNVKIPYVNGTASSAVASGANGLDAQIFLLSAYEVGFTNSISSYIPVDGACLSYFIGTATKDSKRIAYLDGINDIWWLRSPERRSSSAAWTVLYNGENYAYNCTYTHYVRPAMVFQKDTLVNPSTLEILPD